jgi:hypothetical protein
MRSTGFMFVTAALARLGAVAAIGGAPDGLLPSPPSAQASQEISVGEEVHGTLTVHGAQWIYELTAPSDGTLVVHLSWDPDRGRLELTLADTRFGSDPPIVGRLRVAAGQRYRVTVEDGAPWDYDELLLPFSLTSSIEAAGGADESAGFRVEADAFADGGQGCWQGPFYCGGGYYDETPGNWGDAQVRPAADVDLWYDDGGIVIGGLDGLEWLVFPVTVPRSGWYRVTFRTASPADRPPDSGVVNVGVYGVDDSWIGNQIVPVTGGAGEWHLYVDWQAPNAIYLPAGSQRLTMWAAGGYYNLRSMTFTFDDTR